MVKKKLLYLITEDWYFWSHRLSLARFARDSGYEVVIATRITKYRKQIEDEGFRIIEIRMQRQNKNLLNELLAIIQLIMIYRRERPDIAHHVAIKPILYGSIAARLTKTYCVVNAITGIGYLFTSSHKQAIILRWFLKPFFKAAFSIHGSIVIMQNYDDVQFFVEKDFLRRENAVLIRGSGVDTNKYFPTPEVNGQPLVVLASRMLWDKGVKEFVEAAKLLRDEGVAARFVLVGDNDPDNPAAIPSSTLRAWGQSKYIEWWGFLHNMPDVFQRAHIVVLPSYREGLPKVLLEAASCGRAIVTTNAAGCREIVQDGVNGLLVPIHDSQALARAIKLLIDNKELRQKMGREGRRRVLEEFSQEHIASQTLALYKKMSPL